MPAIGRAASPSLLGFSKAVSIVFVALNLYNKPPVIKPPKVASIVLTPEAHNAFAVTCPLPH
jgi:hypothetical protein